MKTPSPIPTRSGRRWLAGALAALLALGGSIITVAPALADEVAPAAVAAPVLSVTPAEDLDPALAHTFTVSGTGYVGPGAANGVYVLLGDASIWSGGGPLVAEGWLSLGWVPAGSIVDGAFTTTLEVPAGSFDPATSYVVATSAAHGLSVTDRTLDAFASITIAQPAPPEPVADPVLTVSPSADLDPALAHTFTVSGTGYVGPGAANGAYVLLGDASIWSGGDPLVAEGWLSLGWVPAGSIVDGAFTTTLEVPAGSFDPATSYVVATSAAHGLSVTDRTLDAFASITIAQPAPPEPTTPSVTVSKTSGLDAAGETITVRGSGFIPNAPATNGVRPPLMGKFAGAYVVFGSFAADWKPSAGAASSTRIVDSQKWVVDAADVAAIGGAAAGAVAVGADGSFEVELTAREFEKALADGNYGVYTFAGSGAKIASFETYTPVSFATTPEPPTPPTPPTPPAPGQPGTIASGSLSWGVASEFRSYVVGNIAKGSISVGSGATQGGGLFQFGQTGGSYSQVTGTGTADYAGSVRFTGHGGVLDLTFASPTLRATTTTSGVLEVSVNGSRVDLATVDLSRGSKSLVNGATRIANIPVTLTAAGAAAFQGYYSMGRALDPLTVVIGSPGAAPAGSSGTVATASAATTAPKAVPATPPATTGIVLDAATLAALVEGKEVTVTVDGFEPNETGIMVVVYSTPIVLARDLVADANGVVTWTGSLPAGLGAGEHTLTFQGSTAKGIRFTVTAPAGMCTVTDATLDWGFKGSFLQYLEGGIANGEWIVTGAGETDGVFEFAGGTGSIEAETVRGLVSFPGSIEFTGHDGALDTTISNPSIELVGSDEAYLRLDVTGTTQQGEAVTATAVRFASLDLDGALVRDGDSLVGTAVPAEFTAEGAAAFGTYSAGEELDPVSFAVALPADCGIEAGAAKPEVQAVVDDDLEVQATSADGPAAWLIWLIVAIVVLVLAAIGAFLIIRNRRAAR
ncbi:HtaA domain-containing protein [Agromyces laixinhei]|uniref:HtaA domain-containing protein n=1 Tax=Agromyces laixinhei TaxID=2585717 RepID=UPI0012ECEFC0|nr:HtaA domain-containing protein [Agromyces laixinhei]